MDQKIQTNKVKRGWTSIFKFVFVPKNFGKIKKYTCNMTKNEYVTINNWLPAPDYCTVVSISSQIQNSIGQILVNNLLINCCLPVLDYLQPLIEKIINGIFCYQVSVIRNPSERHKKELKPIKADSHFLWPISLKIAGNVHNGKNRIPLFLFLCKVKDNEDNRVWIFLSFFNNAWFSDLPGLPNFYSV